jgi:hypothetical protein
MLTRMISFFVVLSLISCGGNTSVEATTPPVAVDPTPANLNILVIGQSISSNCNDFIYGPSANVMQIAKDGSIKAAQDPFEWADCTKGSMWMPLGKRIIEARIAKQVTFMPIGVAGSKIADWQSGGPDFGKLNEAINLVKKNGVSFDFAIWHQGSADFGMSRNEYATRLLSIISYVNQKIPVKRWLIGVHSRCWGGYDAEIEAAQRSVADAPASNRYLGANTNTLDDSLRVDQCHLNQKGQEQAAALWLDAIQNASAGK